MPQAHEQKIYATQYNILYDIPHCLRQHHYRHGNHKTGIVRHARIRSFADHGCNCGNEGELLFKL